MNKIVFDEDNPVTSDQLIWALFRDGKNGKYAYLFKKKDVGKE